MVHHLYVNFLENKKVYNLVQGYWRQLFSQLSQKKQLHFVPYLNMETRKGTKEYDGNPVFNAWEKTLNRTVRIIQVAPQEETLEVSAWMDTIELTPNEAPVPELVLSVVLSRESYAVAARLITTWMDKKTTAEDMEAVIEREAASF